MVRELKHIFPNHKAVKVRQIKRIPYTNIYFWLPEFFSEEWEWVTPKGGRLTLDGMILKYKRKVEKLKKKMNNDLND